MFPNRYIYWEKGLVKVYMKDKSSFSSQLRIGTFFNYEAIILQALWFVSPTKVGHKKTKIVTWAFFFSSVDI